MFNVKEVTVVDRTSYAGTYSTDSGYRNNAQLFQDKNSAVLGAKERLDEQAEKLRKAGYALHKRRLNLEKLLEEIGGVK